MTTEKQLPTVKSRIDDSPLSWPQMGIFVIAFMLNVVDGFDVVAMSVSMPALTQQWGLVATQKGYILSAALIGMTMGAMFLAPYADIYGRRKILLFATVLIGTSMVVTGLIPQSVWLMMLVRFVSGLGIGIIFANSAAIASEFAPERYRNLVVTLVVMGYPFGAMAVGPVASIIIPAHGWEMVFIVGGIFTLVMAAVIYRSLPESVELLLHGKANVNDKLNRINAVLAQIRCQPLRALPPVDSRPPSASVRQLFTPQLSIMTLAIWTIYLCGFLSLYFLMAWIPTLFVNSGLGIKSGVAALTLYNLGAVVGITAIGLIATKIRLAKPIGGYFLGAAFLLMALAYCKPSELLWLNTLIFLIGLLLQGGFTAMYALAARIYPTRVRATGIGWAAGLGRIGAIISPIVAGYLVASHWTMYDLFMLFSAPLVVAGIVVLWCKDE